MLKIEHIALWSKDIDVLKDFYIKYFNATSNNRYHNQKTSFKSYFLSFEAGSRLEIMQLDEELINKEPNNKYYGYVHIAISVGSKELVVKITEEIRKNGYTVFCEPRTTGDGYFESVILDPDGNKIEITI